MRRDELFERFPPLGGMLPGPIPSYIGTGAGGNPVQVHLIRRESPSFPRLADLLVKAQTSPPSDPFQVLDLPDEVAVVTGGLPPGVGFEDWIREATSGAQAPQSPSTPEVPPTPQAPPVPSEPSAPPPAEESYTQYFQLPQDPPKPPQDPPTTQPSVASPPVTPPGIPDPTPEPSDYSEFFQAPAAGEHPGPGSVTSSEPDPLPPPPAPTPAAESPVETDAGGYTEFFQAAEPSRPPAPPPPPPNPAGPPPPAPTQLSVPAPPPVSPPQPPAQAPLAPPPAREPDPDSITAEFRRPMPPPPDRPSGRGRNWAPSQGGDKPQALAMGEYLSRLDSSSGPSVSGTPRPPAPPTAPAAPSWASDGGSHKGGGPSAPTVVTRAPTPQGDGAPQGRRFRTRDLVIFGAVVGVVIIAAITAIVIVILSTD